MKKFVLMLGVAAIAIYGTYSLVSALQKPDAVADGPAAIGAIAITPSTAFVNTTLQARIEGERGALADPGACRWFVNDSEVSGVTGATLEPGHFKKGDSVRVEAGTSVSKTIVIANSLPQINRASADLKQEPSAEIIVRVGSIDADGDAVTYSYEWFKNGNRVDGQTGSSIDVAHFKKGDKVYAAVTASDGEGAGPSRRSDPIVLGSNAPKITSNPPTTLGDERRFIYQVKVGPGSGSLTYDLVESPSGMTISDDGLIEWTVPVHDSPDGARAHKAVVKVTDSMGGHSTQEFSITTSILASSTAGE